MDDPQAAAKLEAKLVNLETAQETMKAVNAYFRKNKTLEGCPSLTPEQITKLQQEMAREHSVIMDGRDIGTVVLPDAEVKIYLDAGVEERARRRVGELQEKGETADFEEIKKMILERDYNDMHRAHSPLKRAADAVSLDSTGMGIDAVLHAILDIVAERVKEK